MNFKIVKYFIYIGFLILSVNCFSQNDTKKSLLASCCTELRGCTGSSYCTACKNCTGCKHCAKNGGSCGVCTTGRRTYKSRQNNTVISTSIVYKKDDMLYVSNGSLNLREGPGSNYKIIERLKKNVMLVFIEKKNSWSKVMVKNTKVVGYVYTKYVSKL